MMDSTSLIQLTALGAGGYWLLINCGTYFAFGLDKDLARDGGRRIPETVLLNLAFFGGSVGAKLGQRTFRHKTRKEPFRSTLNLICVLHFGGIAFGLWWWLA